MIVDDEPYNILVVRKLLLAEGYGDFVTTSKSVQALDMFSRAEPDVLLLDIMMPEVSGLEILEAISQDERLRQIPVIILTAANDAGIKAKALQLGAADFMAKPIEPTELVPRIRNVLAAKAHRDQLERYSIELECEVRKKTAQLEASRRDVIAALARAAEYRDDDTGQHVIRVGKYAGIIASELGFSPAYVEQIELAAQLHDVGKIGITDSILLKPGKLEPEEFRKMQNHTQFGQYIIEPADDRQTALPPGTCESKSSDSPRSSILRMASIIAQTHHERWDGSGYPRGLSGEDIPIEGRITAVADVFDALSSERPYKEAFPREKCLAILEEGRDCHFDGTILDAFFRRIDDIIAVQDKLMD
ncbi:HD domain-containing phosphohydrolase [Thalassoroseus pseudoceratinae]|uniref:HD domain-containing phosphohydrolase n=1 Tax=Thalassoroseus pseudoceratinae TaxID=2713176 RepID=UPI00198238EF|nr:HD domain-containing phosphohydrolase [Thalassoroseus pseudoceratinae]